MTLDLDSGDVGIEDTLYAHFTDEYKYINKLARQLIKWVSTIQITDTVPKTTLIDDTTEALYITFNYTSVLETVYSVREDKVIHIHGSLQEDDDNPVLGHGDKNRMNMIQQKRQKAEEEFNEKLISICSVIGKYYTQTYKDINLHMNKLNILKGKGIDEIIVIGHSIAGVDLPYFKYIDNCTMKTANWRVYYYYELDMQPMLTSLVNLGIDAQRIEMIPSCRFYDIK